MIMGKYYLKVGPRPYLLIIDKPEKPASYVSREKGSLLSFVYKFGRVAHQSC